MTHDALVVGGGPSGCAAAISIARAGASVALVDRRHSNATSWASLLTADGRAELARFDTTPAVHEISQVRLVDGDHTALRTLSTGLLGAVSRPELDDLLLDAARSAGVRIFAGYEAHRPIIERGFLRGAGIGSPDDECDVLAEYTVIADGANSTFGRALGTHRRRDLPHLICARGSWPSPLSRVVESEILIGLRRATGDRLPGHGVVVPDGRGSLTITVVIPSMTRDAAAVNPLAILEDTARSVADRWAIDPNLPSGELRATRLPVGRSVGPVAGPTFLVVGDAAATADPLTALGLAPAIASGALAGTCVAEAIATGASAPLQAFPDGLATALRTHHRRAAMALQVSGRDIGSRLLAGAVRLAASAGRREHR